VLFRLWEPGAPAAPGAPGKAAEPGAPAEAGETGVAWVPDRAGGRHLLVSRHADVRAILADPEAYRPDNALDAMTPIPVSALRILARHGFRLPATLANNGTPSHPAIRALVAEALHPARVEAQRPWLTGLVRRRVTALRECLRAGQRVDLYADLAADLPLLVLARLVALPDDDVAVVKRFSRAALELFWAPVDAGRQRDLAEIVGHYHAALRGFAAEAPGLVGRLREAGHSPDVIMGALFFLLVAGQETTSQFLTLLMHRLIGEPAVTAGLIDGTVRVDDVVEEGLRLEPPIVTWRRVAARDTTIGGHQVPAGTGIVLWLARAGRDITPAPAEFVPGQPGSRRHLAFGAGAHRCVGAQLSRMEAAVVVAETAPLLRRVEVRKAPWCPDNLSFRMPDTLLVASRIESVLATGA
jgi:cytochrome P450